MERPYLDFFFSVGICPRVGAAVAGAKPLVLRQGSHGAPWQLLEHLTVPSVDGGQREREKRLKKASLLTFFEFSTSFELLRGGGRGTA